MGLNLTYYPNNPTVNQNPSNSQPQILQNFASIGASTMSWTTQDHFGFGTGTDGQHKFVSLPANPSLSDPGTISGLGSAIYPAAGSADTSSAQLFYRNKNLNFLLSSIRAFGVSSGNSSTLYNGYNVSSVGYASGTLTVTLPAGAVTGTNYSVICSTSLGTGGQDQIATTYTINSNTSFSIKVININNGTPVVVDTISISFIVLQV